MKLSLALCCTLLGLALGCKDKPNEQIADPAKKKTLVTKEVVVFSSNRTGVAKNIFMMTRNGQILRQITKEIHGEFASTSISRDSSRVLFYKAAPGYDIDVGMDIYIYMTKEDSIIGPITQGHPGNFSPDGRKFVFSRYTFTVDGGYESVYLYDLLSKSEIKLTEDGKSCFLPQISPDGMTICYETARFPSRDSIGCWQLHLMSIDGRYNKDLTPLRNGHYAGNGVFSRDGRLIFFSYNAATWCFDICRVDISTLEVGYLTRTRYEGRYDNASNAYTPAVAPDGATVYFYTKTVDTQYPHFIDVSGIDVNGSGRYKLTNDSFWDSHPVSGVVQYYVEE